VQAGVIGAGMHIAMHAFGKITLFFCAGAIYVASKKTEISDMKGLGRAMPLTMLAFFIGALSIIGLPPTGGTWSKWYLMLGTLEAEYLILMGVLMVSSLLNIAYLLPLPVYGFFCCKDDDDKPAQIKEAPWPCLLAIGITVTGCLLLFFFPQVLHELNTLIYEGS
jgi:multicomponent Na+:H+ antiporter subunit D